MKRIFVILLALFFVEVNAQQYKIGKMTKTYQDPARNNRNVGCDIYYPATSNGNNTPWATGQFPLIVFGHGFVMSVDAYAYFKDAMVPLGYIVVFPTTESGFSPNHAEFGADLAFLVNKIKSEATNPSSEFYNKVTSKSAIMGHSMGGGSSFLACKNNTVPTCMVTFAAAKTNPSSITAAMSVTIPSLVIAGEKDCVAPPDQHQKPMYDSLASSCKYYISIKNGGHCYFGDYNFNCTFGESTCSPTLPITREEQQKTTLDFTKLYLAYYLKNDVSALSKFQDSLNTSQRITYFKYCPSVEVEEMSNNNSSLNISFDNVSNYLWINNTKNENKEISVEIFNLLGQNIYNISNINVPSNSTQKVNLELLKSGYYIARVKYDNENLVTKFVKQ